MMEGMFAAGPSFGGSMTISSVLTFDEPDQMEAAHTTSRAEVLQTGRERLAWHTTRVELDNIWLASVQESGPRLRYVELTRERTFLSFLVRPGHDVSLQGVSRLPNSLIRYAQGQAFYERTSGPTDWVSLSIPTPELAAAGSALANRDLSAPKNLQVVIPAPGNMANLLRAQTTISNLAENAPHLLAKVEVVRALKQSLVDATVACLCDSVACDKKWAHQTHDTIMRRFRRVLEERPDRSIYVPEICAAIGVPDRTLRLCCQEHLAMSPKQYLMRRRLYLVRKALLAAETETTITDVATRFGFWHLGRFSAGYHAIFGELPSITLAHHLH
jgi:AraC-like DNA-binding protein